MAMPQRTTDEGASPGVGNIIPFSCVTGNAKTVGAKVMTFRLSDYCRAFLAVVMDETFGNAGRHRRAGREEYTCQFRLAQWLDLLQRKARELGDERLHNGWRKPRILAIRDQLVEQQILTYVSGEPGTGTGTLAWNLTLDEWQTSGHGGVRSGAGNPQFGVPTYQDYLQKVKAVKMGADPALIFQDENTFQVETVDLSRLESLPADTPFKIGKPDSFEGVTAKASSKPLKRGTNKGSNNSDTSVSGGATATAAPSKAGKAKKPETKPTSSKGPKEPTDPAWPAVRQMGFDLLTDTYGKHGFHHGVEAGALVRLFRDYHIRSPDELRDVWESTLIDPRWEVERRLSMTIIGDIIAIYRRSPEGYRLGMRKKREKHERSNGNGNHRTNGHQPGHPENWKAAGKAGPDDGNRPPEDGSTDDPGADVEGTSPEELAKRYAGYDLF